MRFSCYKLFLLLLLLGSYFSASSQSVPADLVNIRLNFSDTATASATGWIRDVGHPYGSRGNGLVYGWLETDGTTPLDLRRNGRNRRRSGIILERNTILHMQWGDASGGVTSNSGNAKEGIWEMAVRNGRYLVTVTVGDRPDVSPSTYTAFHSITVEQSQLINRFQGSTNKEFETASAVVAVSDGKLTIRAAGGFNTKICSVEIVEQPVVTPKVIAVTPMPNATNIPVNIVFSVDSCLLVNLGEAINASTLNSSSVRLVNTATGNPVAATLQLSATAKGFTLTPVSPLAFSTTYRLEVTNALQDAAGVAFEAYQALFRTQPTPVMAFQASNGLLVVEAENFQARQAGTTHQWLVNTAQLGFSGAAAMGTSPNNGTTITTSIETNSPSLTYQVNFDRTGRHHIWLRVFAPNGSDNSVHTGLNGIVSATSDNIEIRTYGQWVWTRSTMDNNANAFIDILNTGLQQVNLWMREDGLLVDRVLFTTDAAFVPSGVGPAESAFLGITPLLAAPRVLATNPASGATGVSLTANIATTNLFLPNPDASGVSGVNPATVNNSSVRLVRVSDNQPVVGTPSVSANGDAILFAPASALLGMTEYRFEVTAAVRDRAGAAFQAFNTTFTTAASSAMAYQQDPGQDGLLVIEAENFESRTGSATHQWVGVTSQAGFVGAGAMTTSPNNGAATEITNLANSPSMTYRVNFLITGTHYVWLRVFAPSGADNSAHMGIDGRVSASADKIETTILRQWTWVKRTIDGPDATMNITTTGSRLVTLWMREDGMMVDRLLFTTNPSYTPTGNGPTQSAYTAIDALLSPRVLATNPANSATGVQVNTSISANSLFLPNPDASGVYGVDNSTVNNANIKLFRLPDLLEIPGVANGTAGGDAITFTPSVALAFATQYRFQIGSGVKDRSGIGFEPFEMVFTTSDSTAAGPATDLDKVSFNKVGRVASGARYTSLTIGPDRKLYGLTLDGQIHRWVMNPDGTLANREVILTLQQVYGPRAAIGFTFDPQATATNLIAWISHGVPDLSGSAPDWEGKISRLTGANLQNERLVVNNLPRSVRDHLTNSIAFRPGEPNALYFLQGSNSAGGAPDNSWGNRPEQLLSAALLKLDLTKLPESAWPLDARTTQNQALINAAPANNLRLSDGTYNPYATASPLTIYASGIRNAYDLVWHTNGQLYVPHNGTAAGSRSPASVNGTRRPNGTFYNHSNASYPVVPSSTQNPAQPDWLFRINPTSSVGYYGHPNPLRGEYVHNRGYQDVATYPTTVVPDINFRGIAFDFGPNKSPNGAIEYQSNAENGFLKGAILVVRYSGGDDIIALVPNGPNGNIGSSKIGIPGFTGFSDPLDLVEDVETGNIYVSEFATMQITLVKPNNPSTPMPAISLNVSEWIVNDQAGDNVPTAPRQVILKNSGNAPMSGITVSLTGSDASSFVLNAPAIPTGLASGDSTLFEVLFNPATAGPKYAKIAVGATGLGVREIELKGLGESGEPSLQWILDTYFGSGVINVGDDNPATAVIHTNSSLQTVPLLGQEITAQSFVAAQDGPVTVEIIGVYAPNTHNPVFALGWHQTGSANVRTELIWVANVPASNSRTLTPIVNGVGDFDPSDQQFNFFTRWPNFSDRLVYGESPLNQFAGAIPHHMRVYSLESEIDAYVIAFEAATTGFDYQDVVFIARNVKPVNPNIVKRLTFTPDHLSYATTQGVSPATKNTLLSSTYVWPTATLTKSAPWILVSSSSSMGTLNVGVDATGLSPGTYTGTVIAQVPDYTGDTLMVTLVVGSTSTVNAVVEVENMQKIPGTSIGFPADDLFVFQDLLNPSSTSKFWHHSNVMRVHNKGTAPMQLNGFVFSTPSFFRVTHLNGTAIASVADSLPYTILPGRSIDVTIRYSEPIATVRTVRKESVQVLTNAANNTNLTVRLNAGVMLFTEGNNEFTVPEIASLFNINTNTLYMGRLRLSSDYPIAADVDAGKHGDLVLSQYFKALNPNQNITAVQLAGLQGPNSSSAFMGSRFLYSYSSEWHQSLFPRSINTPDVMPGRVFRTTTQFDLKTSNYSTIGLGSIDPVTGLPSLLGVRVFKVKDANGVVIPGAYYFIQDFTGTTGCGAGTANCDFNDNVHYFTNIRPAIDPFLSQALVHQYVAPAGILSYNVSSSFNKGYPGNQLTYSATLASGAPLPSWINIHPQTGVVSGVAPNSVGQFDLRVTATDLNLITAQGTFSVFVTTSPAPSNARMANLTVTTPLSDMLVVDIFPNPAHEFINVTIENPAGEQLQVEVLGYDGKILSRRQIDQVMLDFAIDMKSFGPGLYILHVIGANGSISKKFVME